MSADNYYIIRKHPAEGFAAVMGSGSEGDTPPAQDRHQSFPTVDAALEYAYAQHAEYGVTVHPEVWEGQGAVNFWAARAHVDTKWADRERVLESYEPRTTTHGVWFRLGWDAARILTAQPKPTR